MINMNSNPKQHIWFYLIKVKPLKGIFILILMVLLTASCDDFVDVDLPNNQLTAETVFEDEATAKAALRHIYSTIGASGLPTRMRDIALYTDELDSYSTTPNPFFTHTLAVSNGTVFGMWSNSYNIIYATNAVIEGVENSSSLSLEDKNQLIGEALFIRAYLHSLLVELWGPIPYISTTDYVTNTTVSRMSVDMVYNHIIADLTEAAGLLGPDISEESEERIRVYDSAVQALLARVYLYTERWELAEEMAEKIISKFVLEPDLNKVFLKNSSGTIWQLKPLDGQNTVDADVFIFTGVPRNMALSETLCNAFELNDQRAVNWVGTTIVNSQTGKLYAFPFKYKEASDTSTSLEYPIMLRLAEQYLIRAEARVMKEVIDISGAQADLNVIRNRAGLTNTMADNRDSLLDAIFDERQVELFTEQGHRWFDLKRTRKAAEVLAPIKPGWRDTDILLPVPESEILINPNLLPQNDGYN